MASAVEGGFEGASEAGGEASTERSAHQDAGAAVHDGFAGAPGVERDDRRAAGLRLDRHHAEVLDARQQDRAGLADTAARISSSARQPRNSTSVAAELLQPFEFGAAATTASGTPAARHAAMASPAACKAPARKRPEIGARRGDVHGRAIKVSIYRRIHDGRPAIIVSADPPRNIMRVRDESGPRGLPWRRPSGRAPPAPAAAAACGGRRPARDRSTRRTGPRRSASASGSSRRVPRGRGDHRLHRAVAAADDQVVTGRGRRSRRRREERQEVAVEARRAGQPLDERSVDAARFERGETEPLHVEQRVQRGSGNSSQIASSTFSPPRMPVSQSWTSATRSRREHLVVAPRRIAARPTAPTRTRVRAPGRAPAGPRAVPAR